jgi:hypothetical protein
MQHFPTTFSDSELELSSNFVVYAGVGAVKSWAAVGERLLVLELVLGFAIPMAKYLQVPLVYARKQEQETAAELGFELVLGQVQRIVLWQKGLLLMIGLKLVMLLIIFA